MYKKIMIVIGLTLMSTFAFAGGADALIALDKAWGSAAGPDDARGLVSDKLIAVDADGVTGKAELMETMASGPQPEGPYVAGDYQVEFLGSDTAVMVHSAGSGDDAHWSMHVWQKIDGNWQVAATASIAQGK